MILICKKNLFFITDSVIFYSYYYSRQENERSTGMFEHLQYAGRVISLQEIDNKSYEQLNDVLCVIGRVRSSVQGFSREYFLRRYAHAIPDCESELKMFSLVY